MPQNMVITSLQLLKSNKCFGGYVQKYIHRSPALGGLEAKFAIYIPSKAQDERVPVLYWLSGLTCNEDNFMQKAGVQPYAEKLGIAIVCPDTSPRTTAASEIAGEHDSYDFGSGAGFYVNATEAPWSAYYNMYDYINGELPILLRETGLPLQINNASISGHSMGGHGALISYLRNPLLYKSVSAFSPICNPINCRWGQKCFSNYLGEGNWEEWRKYDATELISTFHSSHKTEILIDQGTEDEFLRDGEDEHNQLLPQNLVTAAQNVSDLKINLRMKGGYDHSYYFISSFIRDHLDFHAKYLKS